MILAKNKIQWESLGDEVATNIMTKGYKPSFKSIPELTLQPPSYVSISRVDRSVKRKYFIWFKNTI